MYLAGIVYRVLRKHCETAPQECEVAIFLEMSFHVLLITFSKLRVLPRFKAKYLFVSRNTRLIALKVYYLYLIHSIQEHLLHSSLMQGYTKTMNMHLLRSQMARVNFEFFVVYDWSTMKEIKRISTRYSYTKSDIYKKELVRKERSWKTSASKEKERTVRILSRHPRSQYSLTFDFEHSSSNI